MCSECNNCTKKKICTRATFPYFEYPELRLAAACAECIICSIGKVYLVCTGMFQYWTILEYKYCTSLIPSPGYCLIANNTGRLDNSGVLGVGESPVKFGENFGRGKEGKGKGEGKRERKGKWRGKEGKLYKRRRKT